jgi:hypothetical protein
MPAIAASALSSRWSASVAPMTKWLEVIAC